MLKYSPGMLVEAPCYIENLPADIYHAHDSISNSGLKLVARSPAHFRYAPEKQETRNKVLGSALHMAILEPDLYKKTYTRLYNAKDRVCRAYRDAKEEFGEENVLVANECRHVEGIRDSLWEKYGELLSQPGRNELSGFSIDPETGVICRHRFDKLTHSGIAIDLKTCIDARPDAFSRAINNYGYHVQAAFYCDQYHWITGEYLEKFEFLVVESEQPYACKKYTITQESLEVGRSIYRMALNEYAECKNNNVWPAYENDEVEEIGIPNWAIQQHDNQQIESMIFMED